MYGGVKYPLSEVDQASVIVIAPFIPAILHMCWGLADWIYEWFHSLVSFIN